MAPVIRNLQIGDATNEDFLRSLGVGNFDICVVGVGDSFQTALEITVLLKDLGAQYVPLFPKYYALPIPPGGQFHKFRTPVSAPRNQTHSHEVCGAGKRCDGEIPYSGVSST